jgi:hypothetical protein
LTKTRFIINALALIVCSLTFTSLAQARYVVGDFRIMAQTFVKPYGDDNGPCTQALPCKSFNTAMTRTSPGGEVVAMESGVYAPMTITNAITILAPPGVQALILSPAGVDAVTINPRDSDVVVLRNLKLKSLGGSDVGIKFETGGTFGHEELHVEGLVIDDFMFGVTFNGPARLSVSDTTTRGRQRVNTWLLSGVGILIPDTADSQSKVTIERCRIERYELGISNIGNRLTVRDSVITDNLIGIFSNSPDFDQSGLGTARSVIENTVVTHCLYGIQVSGTAVLWLANSTLSYNAQALLAPAANRIFSQVNNHNIIRWNDSAGTSPTLLN